MAGYAPRAARALGPPHRRRAVDRAATTRSATCCTSLHDEPEVARAARWYPGAGRLPVDALHRRRHRVARVDDRRVAHRQPATSTRLDVRPRPGASLGRERAASCRRCARPASVVGTVLRRGRRATLGLPDGVQVVAGTPDLHSGARRRRHGARLRDPPRDQHHVLDQLPGAVQEDRRAPPDRDRSRPRAAIATSSRNNHETGGACLQWLRDQIIAPATALGPASAGYAALTDAGGGRRAGRRRRPVHALALRRALARSTTATRAAASTTSRSRPTRADLVRAVLEGVAYNSRWLHEAVEQFAEAAAGPRPRSSAAARSPTSGARSTPTCWTARSSASPTRSTPTCAAPRCSPGSRSARCARTRCGTSSRWTRRSARTTPTARPTTASTPSSRSSTRPRRRCSGG